MYAFGSGRGGRCWGEWVRRFGLGIANPGGTWGKWDNVSVFWLRWCGWYWGEWLFGLRQGLCGWGWCYICVCCESGLFVLMAGPGICLVC